MGSLGLVPEFRPFRFGMHLYANLALHFGLGVVASALFLVSPWLALTLHALAGISYMGDSAHRFYLLRRLLRFRVSRNLVATHRAAGPPALRVVLMAHIDAAYTGALFDPRWVRRFSGRHDPSRPLRGMRRPLRVATLSLFALAVADALAMMWPGGWALPVLAALTVPCLLAFLINAEVILRNRVVPGANDNLSGCAALVVAGRRLLARMPLPVELVLVATGAEEAGVGGAWALCRQMRAAWDPSNTVIVGIDGLSGGELRWFRENEILRLPVAPWLEELLARTAASDERFAAARRFEMGVGATDAGPFQAAGYDAVTVGCVDPELGSPRHYHLPQDTPSNLDMDQLARSVEFVEQLVLAIVDERIHR